MVRLVVDVIENYSMKISRKLRFLTLLLGVIVLSSHAQEVEDTVEPAAPGLESLGSDW